MEPSTKKVWMDEAKAYISEYIATKGPLERLTLASFWKILAKHKMKKSDSEHNKRAKQLLRLQLETDFLDEVCDILSKNYTSKEILEYRKLIEILREQITAFEKTNEGISGVRRSCRIEARSNNFVEEPPEMKKCPSNSCIQIEEKLEPMEMDEFTLTPRNKNEWKNFAFKYLKQQIRHGYVSSDELCDVAFWKVFTSNIMSSTSGPEKVEQRAQKVLELQFEDDVFMKYGDLLYEEGYTIAYLNEYGSKVSVLERNVRHARTITGGVDPLTQEQIVSPDHQPSVVLEFKPSRPPPPLIPKCDTDTQSLRHVVKPSRPPPPLIPKSDTETQPSENVGAKPSRPPPPLISKRDTETQPSENVGAKPSRPPPPLIPRSDTETQPSENVGAKPSRPPPPLIPKSNIENHPLVGAGVKPSKPPPQLIPKNPQPAVPHPIPSVSGTPTWKESSILKEPSTKQNEELLQIAELLRIEESNLSFEPPQKFQICFEPMELLEIYDYNRKIFKSFYWAQEISNKIKAITQTCCFNARSSPTYSKQSVSIRGKCSENCLRFFGNMNYPNDGEKAIIDIQTKGVYSLSQSCTTGRHIKGPERDRVAAFLEKTNAQSVFIENIAPASALEILHKNLAMKSPGVLRNIKKEAKSKLRLSEDIFVDIKKFNKSLLSDEFYQPFSSDEKFKGFVQNLSYTPFRLDMYAPTQIKVVNYLTDKCRSSDWFIDSTGTLQEKISQSLCIAEKEDRDEARLFHYSIIQINVGENDKRFSVVVGESITNLHNFPNIENFVLSVVTALKKNKPTTKLCNSVTTDFSFATLHSLLTSINQQSIMDYIIHSHQVMKDKVDWNPEFKFIHICINHVIHAVSSLYKKHNIPRKVKEEAMGFCVKLQAVVSHEDFVKVSKAAILLFDFPELPKEQMNRLQKLFVNTPESETQMKLLSFNQVEFGNHIENQPKNQREKSPFYQDFIRMRQALQKENTFDTEHSVPNMYYCPKILTIIGNNYIPYLPFISAGPRKIVDPSFVRSSNAFVESYFRDVKTLYHTSHRKKVPDFLRDHTPVVKGIVQKVIFNLGIKQVRKTKEKIPDKTLKEYSEETNKGGKRERKPLHVPPALNPRKSALDKSGEKTEDLNQNSTQHKENKEPSIKSEEKDDEGDKIGQTKAAGPVDLDSDNEKPRKDPGETITEKVIDDVLAVVDLETLKEKDLKCLSTGSGRAIWLNDAVMNTYLQYMFREKKVKNSLKLFTSYFVMSLESPLRPENAYPQPQGALDSKEKERLLKLHGTAFGYCTRSRVVERLEPTVTEIFFPVFVDNNHWILATVNIESGIISFFDSLPRKCPLLYDRLFHVISFCFMLNSNKKHWSMEVKLVGKQANCDDCGVWVFKFVENLLSGTNNFHYTEKEITECRFTVLRNLLATTAKGVEILTNFNTEETLMLYLQNI